MVRLAVFFFLVPCTVHKTRKSLIYANFSLKLGLTALFTHFKKNCYSVFNFQFSTISSIQTDPYYSFHYFFLFDFISFSLTHTPSLFNLCLSLSSPTLWFRQVVALGHDYDNGRAKGGYMGLGFELWRRSMTDLGLGFEEHDVQVAIWVLVVANLRFWVVMVDAAWLWCHCGCGGSSVLLVVAPFLCLNPDPCQWCLLQETFWTIP